MTTNAALPNSVVDNIVAIAGTEGMPKLLFLGKNNELIGEIESRNLFLASGSSDDLDYGSPWAETGYVDPNHGTNDYSKNPPK